MQSALKGHCAAICANVLLGSTLPALKIVLTYGMSPIGFTMMRLIGAVCFFWIVLFWLGYEKVNFKDLILMCVGGILGFLCSQLLTTLGVKYTSIVNCALILSTGPAISAILAYFILKERLNSRKIFGIILGIAGIAVLMTASDSKNTNSFSENLLGCLFLFLSVFAFSLNMVITRKVAATYSPLTMTRWLFLSSFIVLLPLGLWQLPQEAIFNQDFNIKPIIAFSYIMIFSTFISYLLVPFALKNLPTANATIYLNIQPITASVVAIALGLDDFAWQQPIAGALVIGGALIMNLNLTRNKT